MTGTYNNDFASRVGILLAHPENGTNMRLHALSAITFLLALSPAARGDMAPILLGGAYAFFWLEKRAAGSQIEPVLVARRTSKHASAD